jgi:hypothetical protein
MQSKTNNMDSQRFITTNPLSNNEKTANDDKMNATQQPAKRARL